MEKQSAWVRALGIGWDTLNGSPPGAGPEEGVLWCDGHDRKRTIQSLSGWVFEGLLQPNPAGY